MQRCLLSFAKRFHTGIALSRISCYSPLTTSTSMLFLCGSVILLISQAKCPGRVLLILQALSQCPGSGLPILQGLWCPTGIVLSRISCYSPMSMLFLCGSVFLISQGPDQCPESVFLILQAPGQCPGRSTQYCKACVLQRVKKVSSSDCTVVSSNQFMEPSS